MQRQKQQQKLDSFESSRYPIMKSTIKQLIQLDIQKTAQNLKQTNFVIKYPVNQLKQSTITNQCNCNENEYDEINSFSEEDEVYSEYDHLNMSNDNHYLQPANQNSRKSIEESNYYHLYRKNSNASQDSIPPPLPKSKLPEIKPYSIMTTSNELLNKSYASDKFDSFLSPISSGYNSCQDISNNCNNSTNNKKYNSEYYSYYSQQYADSGFSTLNISNRVSDDEDVSSNLSPYYSSPSNSPLSSYSNDLEPMVQASPFPRVNTSFVAQIKQIKSNKKVVSTPYKQEEPIYENLKPVKCNKATKQYSLNDIFNHLNSLDLNEPSRPRSSHFSPINQRIDYNDVLCDKEVEFYLSPTKQLNDLHSYASSAPIKINQFWEQLV